MRITALERMRMQRDQRELPLQRRISELQGKAALAIQRQRVLQTSLDMIAKLLDNKVLEMMLKQMSYNLADLLQEKIFEAAAKAKPMDPVIQVALPANLVHSYDKDSIESFILSQYVKKYKPRLSLRVMDMEPYYTRIQIDIPSLHVRRDELTWE